MTRRELRIIFGCEDCCKLQLQKCNERYLLAKFDKKTLRGPEVSSKVERFFSQWTAQESRISVLVEFLQLHNQLRGELIFQTAQVQRRVEKYPAASLQSMSNQRRMKNRIERILESSHKIFKYCKPRCPVGPIFDLGYSSAQGPRAVGMSQSQYFIFRHQHIGLTRNFDGRLVPFIRHVEKDI